MNVFSFHDYRALLYSAVKERKLLDPTFGFQSLAVAAGVQKSYLSKVLGEQAELNQDQLFLICEFFKWNKEESGYVQLLLEISRCQVTKRKRILLEERERVRVAQLGLEAGDSAASAAEINEYYLDPLFQIVHLALGISRYSQNLETLAQDLGVGERRVRDIVNTLIHLKQVERKGSRLVVLAPCPSPKSQSPLYKVWQNQIRMHSLALSKAPVSHIFVAKESEHRELQNELQALFNRFQKRTLESKADHVYQISVDAFAWTHRPKD